MEPGDKFEMVEKALHDADVILDASASVPVSRYLCDLSVKARRATFFFNPAGTAAVLMVEDAERTVDLRAIEATFYSRILDDPSLADMLVISPERLPYSGDCRALTTRMSSSCAHILSGLVTRGLGEALDKSQAILQIWRLSNAGSVTVLCHRPEALLEYLLGDWTVRLLPSVADRLKNMRQDKLPSETGGALLGVVDIPKKRIEIMGALPPPPDSIERSNEFLRGTKGLERMVKDSMARTLDHIRYVGEWHSHPRGCGTKPSSIDLEQLAVLSTTLSADCCPGVQLIVGDIYCNILLGFDAV